MNITINNQTFTLPKTKPELLLPAGSLQKAKYAFAYGADAVYAGVPVFALRTKENTFTIDTVKELITYTRSLNKKIYLTINIYPHNQKLNYFLEILDQLISLKPDAFIVSDPGIIHLIREKYNEEEVELHLSVQQNTVNWASARFWKNQGIKRIILARELTYLEVKEITQKNPDTEFEYFIHGANCIAYSGRCLLSHYLANRDANQGVCAQSCRWSYKVLRKNNHIDANTNITNNIFPLQNKESYTQLEGEFLLEENLRPNQYHEISQDPNGTYIMNARDTCLIDYLPELISSGVCSLKIEGRNKSEYYAAITAKAYRQAIDDIYNNQEPNTQELLEELQSAGNRGFTTGFFMGDQKEHAQRYEKNEVLQTHCFLGLYKTYDAQTNKMYFHIKNRVNIGDQVELISPTTTQLFTIQDIFNHNDEPVNSVHPGTNFFSTTLPKNCILESEFLLLRRKGPQ
jgi:U32 family peptidase